MSRKRNFLTTYGTLRACVVEALDLVDTPPTNNKKVKVTKSSVFAVLKVTDEAGAEIKHCNTETHPFFTAEALVIGEEFIFENVSSAHSLLVSFYSVSMEKEKTPHASAMASQNCLGFTQIPLSRLEDNVSILQWHQLFSPSNPSDGLRSAVRIECNFASDTAGANKNASAIIRRTASAARHGSEYNNNRASMGSMYFDDYVDEVVEDEDDASEADSSHSSDEYDDFNHEAEPSRERVFLRVTANKSPLSSPVRHAEALHAEAQQEQKEHELGRTDGQSTADKKEDGSNIKLETGLIDYCIILGPAEPFSLLKPTHYITTSGALASLSSTTTSADISGTGALAGPNSPLTSNPYTGLFGENNGGDNEEQEIIIWDRLPRHDHFDIEMPSKLEWFACPEGSKTVLYHKRPDPYYQSFVLSSGGETEEVFGLSINFFIELGSFSALELSSVLSNKAEALAEEEEQSRRHSRAPLPGEDAPLAWWRQVRHIDPNSHVGFFPEASQNDIGLDLDPDKPPLIRAAGKLGSAAVPDPDKLYTVVSLCVLFRASQHVQQLRKCLEYAYYESMLPHLCDWEGRWEAIVREKMASALVTDAAEAAATNDGEETLGFTPNEAASTGLRKSSAQLGKMLADAFQTSFSPFSLHIEKLMATLCLECPVPIPGFLTVKLQFPRKMNVPPADWNANLVRSGIHGSPRCWRGNSESVHTIDDRLQGRLTPHARSKYVEFSAPSPEDFPRCSYPLEVLLKCFGPRVLIDIVCCVLSECRILFHSSDLALLPVICEGLRTLIYPLQWTHVYLPVVPMHLLNVVEAPVPFMLGTHSKWLKYIQIEYMNDMVLVDCDTAAVDMGGSLAMQFPEREDRWLMMALRTIMQPILPNNDPRELCHPLLGRPKSIADDVLASVDTNTKIQLVFYDVLFHLLRYVPDCLFYLNPSCPVFNRPLFISDYASDEYRPALELLTVTNCFHVLTESIHTPSLAFFYKNIVRLTELEKKLMDQAMVEDAAAASSPSSTGGESTPSNSSSQLSLNTPMGRGGRGPLQRGFTRNVSVANIIYDKLVSVSSPVPAQQIGTQRSVGLSTKDGAGEDKAQDSPKIIQHTGRGLTRHISIIGKPDVKEGTPGKSFFAPNAINQGSTDTPNETAYGALLPMWLLKPTPESVSTAVAPAKVDSIRSLLVGRLKYYQPHLRQGSERVPTGDKPSSPKNAEALLKMSSDSVRSCNPEHVLVVQSAYAVQDSGKLTAGVQVPAVGNLNTSTVAADSAPAKSLCTPLAKSRPALVRSGSAQSGARSNGGSSVKFSGVPSVSPKLATSKSTKFAVETESVKGPGMAHPVLNAVPSFRRAPAAVPSPTSPLHRIFQNSIDEQEEAYEDVGFGDIESDEDTPRSFNFGGKYTPSVGSPAAPFNGRPSAVEGPVSPLPTQTRAPNAAADADDDDGIGHFGCDSISDKPLTLKAPSVAVCESDDEDIGNFGKDDSTPADIITPAKPSDAWREWQDTPTRPACLDTPTDGSEDVSASLTATATADASATASVDVSVDGADTSGFAEEAIDKPEETAEETGTFGKEDGEESEAPEVIRPLIEFDENLVAAAQLEVKRWTVLDLASELQVPCAAMLVLYSKMRSNASNRLNENTQFAARHRAINTGAKQNKRSLLNPADTQATFDKLSKMGNQQCDECITMYLQKVVTESILEEHWLENALQSSLKALQDKNNRRCLIDMLKNAKQTKDKRQPVSNVYPLNPAAFEAFSKLFTGVLRICSNQEDYLCAYGLLEVGGLYFRFVVHDDTKGDTVAPQQDEIMEFLSERTCQHPIYHNSALWCELMKSRVPIPAAATTTTAAGATTATPPAKNTRPLVNTVLSEVHSLLFIMLELEVNSSRALLFIQGVASDYSLGINDYYKLQRFVNRIWANNHVDEHAAQAEQDHHNHAALHKPDNSMMKKKSKENMRDRRASMSIGDMLTMQGHNTSRLFKQSSMESMHGITRGLSIKMRTQSISGAEAFDGSKSGKLAASPKPAAARRGSLGSMDENAMNEANEGSGRKRRSKSLHAGSFSLSIDTSDAPDDDEFSASTKGKLKTPSLYPKGLSTPINGRLNQIEEHHSEGDDLSRHSDHNLRSAVSTNSSNHSDSDQLSHDVDSSNPSSPRQDGTALSYHSGGSGTAAPTTVTDDRSLDEMLGLQRVSSAMLMRSSSMMGTKQKSGTGTTVPFEAPRNVPNKFAPLEMTGREEGPVTAFDCVHSWLVTGSEDGALNITDLTTGTCTTKFRHGSGSGDRYRGITNIHCMPTPCPGSQSNLFFSGCSNGIVKAWVIPQNGAQQGVNSPDLPAQPSSYWGFRMNLRLKQSLAVIKVHTAPITALISKPTEHPAGWLLASGDDKGMVCMTRGTEKSSSTTCCSTTIHVNATKPGASGSTVPKAPLSTGKMSISCLSFIGTPSATVMGDTAGGKGKGAKKAGPVANSVGVSAGTAVGGSSGTEEYLGVGTSTGLISVLDINTAVPIYQVAGHTARVTQLIGLRANEFISSSMDRSIKLWDIRTRNRPTQTFAGKILEERSLGPSTFRKCAASPVTAIAVGGGDNSLVISTSADGVVRLWDRRYDVNVPCCVTQGHSNRITAIAWNGVDEFHTSSHDGTVRTWDSINGQNTAMLQAFDEEGITNMKMTTFKCAQHITITPRGPVTFTDHDKLSTRTCIVTSGWNGTIKSFVHDV